MKFRLDAVDRASIKIGIVSLLILASTTCYSEFYLCKPEHLIQNRLNAYGIQASDISFESQEGTGRTKTYTLSNPPIDSKTGQALAHWTINVVNLTANETQSFCGAFFKKRPSLAFAAVRQLPIVPSNA